MLDAILAMALTLAALATIATIVMEACLRAARMRKKNLVEVMKLLNKELDQGPLGMSPEERTQFIAGVIRNPSRAISEKLNEKIKGSSPEDLLRYIGYEKDSDRPVVIDYVRRFLILLTQFVRDSKRTGLYDSVTLEHVLRRLVEVESVQQRSRKASQNLKIELNRLARKHEEFSSAVSASFKRHAQAWSIAVGVLLALSANIDGMRIFEAYLENKELAETVIAQQDRFLSYSAAAGERQSEFEEAVKTLEEAKENREAALASGDDQAIAAADMKLTKAEALMMELASPEKIRQELEGASGELDRLVTIGIPLGWRYYPACRYKESTDVQALDQQCRDLERRNKDRVSQSDSRTERVDNRGRIDDKGSATAGDNAGQLAAAQAGADAVPESQTSPHNDKPGSRWVISRVLTTAYHDFGGFIRWLFAVVLTGLLIGLGAPFWFDVAKRLASIRTGKRDAASAEFRMAANNANGDTRKRKEIVDNVVTDAAGERRTRVKRGELARLVADAQIKKQKI